MRSLASCCSGRMHIRVEGGYLKNKVFLYFFRYAFLNLQGLFSFVAKGIKSVLGKVSACRKSSGSLL